MTNRVVPFLVVERQSQIGLGRLLTRRPFLQNSHKVRNL